MTFLAHDQREKLEQCSMESIIQSVMDAAVCGFALDNKFAYVIPYKNKKVIDGKESWVWEAQCQFDYKAFIAMARRPGTISDIWAQLVHERDDFDWWDERGEIVYKFRQSKGDRGKMIGGYSVAKLPDGNYRFVWMDAAELEKVRKASKSPQSPAWANWSDRMYCKAVVKRCLVGLLDDPGLIKAIDLDNREYEMDRVIDTKATSRRVETYDQLADALHATEPVQAAIEYQPEAERFEPQQEEPEPVTVPAKRSQQPAVANIPPRPQRPSIGNHPSGIR
jgi:phage RecT family recombinase